jgi:hypothetical protein
MVDDLKTEDYGVTYDANASIITISGSLRLNGMEEYLPITQLLEQVLNLNPPLITLDLRELNFLNSSGINVLSKFTISVRKQAHTQLVVRGSRSTPWQSKSLKNLQRLMSSLELQWD